MTLRHDRTLVANDHLYDGNESLNNPHGDNHALFDVNCDSDCYVYDLVYVMNVYDQHIVAFLLYGLTCRLLLFRSTKLHQLSLQYFNRTSLTTENVKQNMWYDVTCDSHFMPGESDFYFRCFGVSTVISECSKLTVKFYLWFYLLRSAHVDHLTHMLTLMARFFRVTMTRHYSMCSGVIISTNFYLLITRRVDRTVAWHRAYSNLQLIDWPSGVVHALCDSCRAAYSTHQMLAFWFLVGLSDCWRRLEVLPVSQSESGVFQPAPYCFMLTDTGSFLLMTFRTDNWPNYLMFLPFWIRIFVLPVSHCTQWASYFSQRKL